MSEIYICRCGEMTKPCWSCVNQTCNNLRESNKDLERQLEEARELVIECIESFEDMSPCWAKDKREKLEKIKAKGDA